ncbi:MAG TPA: mannose-6-phosphate isomerase, class I [Mycobacteriales bacterium]|nr:mannose-6-phosphate isomerase, class I [Mycobacteriales bacterium]
MQTLARRAVDLLDNPIRPYAWGSPTAIPQLLGVPPTGQPQAELWMGAHPAQPSRLRSGGTLLERIEADPAGELSPAVVDRFGPRLPFLLKVIAAARPLSLQAHPDAERAREGYAEEEARGVPLGSPERSYVDANHKPELVCALTPFEALCGFRAIPQTLRLLDALAADAPVLHPHLAALRARPGRDGLREVVTGLLTVPAGRRGALVNSVVAACRAGLAGSSEFRVELATAVELAEEYPGDLGVVITLLLNRLRLQPGDAMFLAAGNLHCYLRGTAVEVLANSDNVLRGGLTPKHVDVPELLRVIDVADGPPPLIQPVETTPGQWAYLPPVPDFRLDRVAAPATLASHGPQIVLAVSGSAVLRDGVSALPLPQGASAWVPAGRPVTSTGTGVLVRATTNLP